MGWSGFKSKKPNIPQPGNRRPTDLPTTIPPLECRTNYSIRIGPWTRPFLHTTPQHNVWPLPPLHLQTKAERKTWQFPLPPQSPRRNMPPRICGRRPHKRHFYSIHDKYRHTKRTPHGNKNSPTSPTNRTRSRTRPRKPKSDQLLTKPILPTHPDNNYPHGTSRHNAPQTSQTPADAVDYNSHSNTCKYASPKKSSATPAKKLDIIVKYAARQN